MKLGILISRIETLFAKGVPNSASEIAERHIYVKALSVRKLLISRQLKKKQKVSDWNYTVLPCVKLIKVPSHECSCLENLGCDVYRTEHPLPKPLTDSENHTIDFVMSIDSGITISEATRQSMLYLKGNKYTSKRLKYIFENQHLYFPIDKNPGLVKIKLLAEDPIEAQRYPSFCKDCPDCVDCTPMTDYEFSLDGELEEPLIAMSVQELLEWYSAETRRRSRGEENQDNAENRA